MKKQTISLMIAAALLLTVSPAFSTDHNHKDKKSSKTKTAAITFEEVNAAQQAWCDAVVAIGKAYDEGGDYKKLAMDILTQAYDYDNGTVFFKPTLTFGDQTFRTTKEGAHSYFVGGNSKFPNDKGFALKPWTKVWYDNLGNGNDGIQIYGNIAITMGNVYFTGKDGTQIMVDKTFVFKKGDDGKIRLIVHKSSLPYSPSN
jgi:hypothetical protein